MTTETKPIRRSAIEAADCLYRFNETYEKGVEDWSDEAWRGEAFHDAARRYIRYLAQAGMTADADEARRALEVGLIATKLPTYLMAETRELFTRWAERFELDLDAYLLSEERQADAEVSWTPDIVYARDEEIEVPDWKTWWRTIDDDDVRQNFQARFYIWQAMRTWPGFPRYRFTFEFVRFNRRATAVFTEDDAVTIEQEVRVQLAKIAEARRTGEWPATPGAHCSFCRLKCPVVDRASREAVRLTSVDDAERLLREYWVLKMAVDVRRKTLAAYCEQNAPVRANGLLAQYETRVERRALADQVLALVAEQGVPSTFELSYTALKPYLSKRSYPRISAALGALIREKPKEQFTVKAVGDQELETDA